MTHAEGMAKALIARAEAFAVRLDATKQVGISFASLSHKVTYHLIGIGPVGDSAVTFYVQERSDSAQEVVLSVDSIDFRLLAVAVPENLKRIPIRYIAEGTP